MAAGDQVGVVGPVLVAGKPFELAQDVPVVISRFGGEVVSFDELVNEVFKVGLRFGYGLVHFSFAVRPPLQAYLPNWLTL